MKSVTALILFTVFFATTTACTTLKPWERDILAREDMQLTADEMITLMDDQIYYSKEAAHGGPGIGGGGCGCN